MIMMTATDGVGRFDVAQQVDAGAVGQHEIAEDEVRLVLRHRRARLGQRAGRLDAPSFFLKDDGEEIAQRRLVVNDQQIHGARFIGGDRERSAGVPPAGLAASRCHRRSRDIHLITQRRFVTSEIFDIAGLAARRSQSSRRGRQRSVRCTRLTRATPPPPPPR